MQAYSFPFSPLFSSSGLGKAPAAQTTPAAPALRRVSAAETRVAPVEHTSSISRTRFPAGFPTAS